MVLAPERVRHAHAAHHEVRVLDIGILGLLVGNVLHPGSGLNITVMSLNGTLDVGIVSCPELLQDLWDLADDFKDALDELLGATR